MTKKTTDCKTEVTRGRFLTNRKTSRSCAKIAACNINIDWIAVSIGGFPSVILVLLSTSRKYGGLFYFI